MGKKNNPDNREDGVCELVGFVGDLAQTERSHSSRKGQVMVVEGSLVSISRWEGSFGHSGFRGNRVQNRAFSQSKRLGERWLMADLLL